MNTEKTRLCIHCDQNKPASEFHATHGNSCKECRRALDKAQREANPVKPKSSLLSKSVDDSPVDMRVMAATDGGKFEPGKLGLRWAR